MSLDRALPLPHQAPHQGRGNLAQGRGQWPPGDCVYTHLADAVLLEQHEHWRLKGRRMFSAESMATILKLGDTPALQALRTEELQGAGPRESRLQRPQPLIRAFGPRLYLHAKGRQLLISTWPGRSRLSPRNLHVRRA